MGILRHSLVAYVEMNLVKGKGYYVDSEKGGEAKGKVEQATVKERASERPSRKSQLLETQADSQFFQHY